MAVEFRIAQHWNRNVKLVEIFIEGKFVGVIYPKDDNGIRVISTHMHEPTVDEEFAGSVFIDDGSASFPPIPSVDITFKPSHYILDEGRVIKIDQ